MPVAKNRGFSLIEVVLAIALFALFAVVLSKSFVNGLRALDQFQRKKSFYQDLQFVRRQVLTIADRDEIEKGGAIETVSSGRARWDVQIESTNVVDLHKVELTVSFSEGDINGGEDIQREHYLLRPTWSDSSERLELLDEKRQLIGEKRSRSRWGFKWQGR